MKSLFTNIQKQQNMLKSSLPFKKNTTLRVTKSKISGTKNAQFSELYFYLNTNIYADFQICISVPLTSDFYILC